MICPNCECKLIVIDSRPTSPGSNERLQKCRCRKCGTEYYVSVNVQKPAVGTTVTTKRLITGYPA